MAAEPLAKRMLRDEGLELGNQLGVAPQGELGLDPCLDGDEPFLLEPGGLGPGERRGPNICESGATPERERLTESLGGCRGTQGAGTDHEPAEQLEIDLAGLGPQRVAGATRLQTLGAQNAPQPVYGDLDRVAAESGGRSPQRQSTIRSRPRTSLAWSARKASSAR